MELTFLKEKSHYASIIEELYSASFNELPAKLDQASVLEEVLKFQNREKKLKEKLEENNKLLLKLQSRSQTESSRSDI